ncbi:MAG: hypothetical protein H6760_03470 [Candidatus Nomurabacteria bacterium]|nr:MAG: hypothetical protein H6760_03470 [Candidatus Nomurabacteria bacterium]
MQNTRLWLTLLIGCAALCVGVALGFWLFQSQEEAPESNLNTNNVVANTNFTTLENANLAVNESVSNTNETVVDELPVNTPTVVPTTVQEIDTPLVFVSGLVNNYVESYDTGTAALQGTKYAGSHMLLLSVRPEGPYRYPLYFRFVQQSDDSLVFLSLYSDDGTWQLDDTKFSTDSETIVPTLDYPSIFTSSANARYLFERDTYVNAFFSEDGLVTAYQDPKYGTVYTSAESNDLKFYGRNGFYMKAADGTVRAYRLLVDFAGSENTPSITWTDGKKNYQQYTFVGYGGCGATNYAEVVSSDDVSMSELEQIGTSSKGDIIYGFKDSESKMLKDLYETYAGYHSDGSYVTSYAEFITQRPIIFYKDPFDRLLKGQNDLYKPLAECGKPVIYLYPEQSTEVEVKVAPSGGFSKTVPEYGNGWKVFAQPNGDLTELASGKQYPYLFWEGRSTSIYETPKQGWVIKKDRVHDFLNTTLAKLGLNSQETADFQEFWEPKMQSAPYYFITFMGNPVMNQLAPLDITPKPDTVIRVLMDYQELDEPINVSSYHIRTPERKGFTVVEWGGVLH